MSSLLPNCGVLFIWAALISCVVSVVAYVRCANSDPGETKFPRMLFILAALCVVGAAVVHASLLLNHRFDINYVYRYSARGLPPFYLFATFWAGQEGSFLLWALWTSLLGVILARTIGKGSEGRVMGVYGCVLGFLLTLLALKSPFAPYVQLSQSDPAGIPADGVGLNPLLENPWMVVHPPTLFLGLSSLAVPFAIGLSALIWNGGLSWLKSAQKWALFGFPILGFGIMLGGYWAYETLGWGGFWGWDPVEIGPFVAWLTLGGFLHTAQATQVRGSMRRTTTMLAIAPFLLALYETFLTRTGILDKFSNHSFSTLGGPANSVILYGMLTAMIASLVLLVWRWKSFKNDSNPLANAASRDFSMVIAAGLLLLCALISGIGMSAPLITQGLMTLHLANAQSSVQADFYNKANFPVGCLLLIGSAIGPYLAWKDTPREKLDPLSWIYPAAVLFSVVFISVSHWLIHANVGAALLFLFACCAFSIVANGNLFFRQLKSSPQLIANLRVSGGAIAHIGAACLLIGVVFLVSWYRVDDQPLVQGHSRPVTGIPMTLTYTGDTSSASEPLLDPTNNLKIAVLEGKADKQIAYTAFMPVAVRDVEGHKQLVARPAIVHRWWGDLYFALKDGPEMISPTAVIRGQLSEGSEANIAGYKIECGNFSADPVAAAEARSGHIPDTFPVTVPMTVTSPLGKVTQVNARYINYVNNPIGDTSPEVKLPNAGDGIPWSIAIASINADTHLAQIYVRDSAIAPTKEYTIEVSTRPMISLVWIGTLLITFGGLLAMRRRVLEGRIESGVQEKTDSERVPDLAPKSRRRRSAGRPAHAFTSFRDGGGN